MTSQITKIGLALSGGGFRASLYHLGLVRFLRDAGILSRVSHITSVSGGSVLAAHLVLNWDRYNGSGHDFDAAASELLSFIRYDVRNRITRRFPLTVPLRWVGRLLRLSNRKLSRTGLLEYYYEKHLYGDTSLFELPQTPQLHILATNLSEGCLCSFNRNGLLMVRRQEGHTLQIHRIHIGLATVAMAVTASSAFPAFFPPLELTGMDVGANVGEFGRQAYTDGGVFDNLGVRMFRCLERPLLAESPLSREDFVDVQVVVEALQQASRSREESPLRRLTQILVAAYSRPELVRPCTGAGTMNVLPSLTGASPIDGAAAANPTDGADWLVSGLSDLLRHYQLQHEPLFASLRPADPDAAALLQASHLGGKSLHADDQFWLNRHLFETALRHATGQACFRRLNSGLDGVLVSDVGKSIQVQSNRRAGGVIRTAMRAADILMDRVWQLETETFHDTPGFVFVPIKKVVEPDEDPTALHPEIQRQVANIRTDLDRFSNLEISSLVKHGYCVGRMACRARSDLFGFKIPTNAPWDPISGSRDAVSADQVAAPTARSKDGPAPTTVEARTLQASAFRRIWSTLLDYRDWVSYIYVPLVIPILVLLPYLVNKYYQRSHRLSQLVESLSEGSRDLQEMTRLLDGPVAPWAGETPEEVGTLDEPDLTGFKVLQDMRILDLRNWNPTATGKADSGSMIYGYRRLKVFKEPEKAGQSVYRIHLLTTSPLTQVRFPSQQLRPKLRMSRTASAIPGQKESWWEASYDFDKVPAGEYVDLMFEELSPGLFLHRGESSTTLTAEIRAQTAEVTRWILLPKGKEYRSFHIVRYKAGMPDKTEAVKIVTEYLAEDSTILAYKLLGADPGTYQLTWYYK